MFKYKVLGGTHRVTETGKIVKKGDVFRTRVRDLHKLFVNKFELIRRTHSDDEDKPKRKRSRLKRLKAKVVE